MVTRRVGWYFRRLRQFMPGEVAWRVTSVVGARRWEHRHGPAIAVPFGQILAARPFVELGARAELLAAIPDDARRALIGAATEIVAGRVTLLGATRSDLVHPNWGSDGLIGNDRRVDLDGAAGGDSLKHMWELSRGNAQTMLAAAFAVTGDELFATRCASLTDDWWAAHPGATGPMFASGVEMAMRLISWVWVRRLLAGSSGVGALFDHPAALAHLWAHQDRLARFPSRFSSANNHRLAEAAGLLCASSAFPWFDASAEWRRLALRVLEGELQRQVSMSGVQREQAPAYHCFVLDLAVVSLGEAAAAGLSIAPGTVDVLCRMSDALASMVDAEGTGPGYGDADESTVARLDGGQPHPFRASMALAAVALGDVWARRNSAVPSAAIRRDVRSEIVGRWCESSLAPLAPAGRPATVTGAPGGTLGERMANDIGPVVMRAGTGPGAPWCAVRVGPLGYLPIAAHAHADLLSVEFRLGAVPVLIDPGTYSYDALPRWRRRLRSTGAHDTLEIDGCDQAEYWGSFLWGTSATAIVDSLDLDDGRIVGCRVSHDGYERLSPPARHRRSVALTDCSLTIADTVVRAGASRVALTYTLGPGLTPVAIGPGRFTVRLDAAGSETQLQMDLPPELAWRSHTGTAGGAGWSSSSFWTIAPVWSLTGEGMVTSETQLQTALNWTRRFTEGGPSRIRTAIE